MDDGGRVLLIQPWIYDFAAFNLWIEPLGLQTIGAALREQGFQVNLVDCLAPHAEMPRPRTDGSGKFLKTATDRPEAVRFVPRRYGRYGWPAERFEVALDAVPVPDLVLVTSGMTYWYPGVVEAIRRVRNRWRTVPLALGGVYATLCPEHARAQSGADVVVQGAGVMAALRLANEVTGRPIDLDRYADPASWPAPLHDLAPRPYAGLLTSWGCPYRCTYCASHRLQPRFVHRQPVGVVAEVEAGARRGVRDFAFYDDALLIDAGRHLAPILEGTLALGVPLRFHSPNGLHAREITPQVARLLRRAGMATAWLSLETIDEGRQRATGDKVRSEEFRRAVGDLTAAGYGPGEVGAYVLAGLPEQPLEEVEEAVRFVQELGLAAKVALYSPIPGTPEGNRALPAEADPLWHSPTVYPYLQGEGYAERLQRIKEMAKAVR